MWSYIQGYQIYHPQPSFRYLIVVPIMSTQQLAPEIVLALRPQYLATTEPNPRGPRKHSRYSDDEIKVLQKYKDRYKKASTTEERNDLLRNYILVDIFNFWYDKGSVTTDISEEDFAARIKVY
jgi:hypothetical protein